VITITLLKTLSQDYNMLSNDFFNKLKTMNMQPVGVSPTANTTPMFASKAKEVPAQPSPLPEVPQTQAPTIPTVQEQPQVAPTISDQDVINATNKLTSMMYSSGNTGSGNVMGDILRLQAEQASGARTGQGMYDYDRNMGLSPDQIRSIENASDKVYEERYGALGQMLGAEKSMEKSSVSSKYGIDSILSGLSSQGASRVNSLADKFDASPIVKNFNTVQASALKANEILNDLKGRRATAGDDMTLMYLFAKAQDPESVVRESEYENVAQYFSSMPQNVKYQFSRLYEATPDGRLTDQSRANIYNNLNKVYSAQKRQYDNLKKETVRKINQVAGSEIGEDLLTDYNAAYEYNNEPSNDNNAFIEAAKSEGWSDEEIQSFLEGKQSFNQVGNTTASIPKTSRLAYVNNNPGNLRFAGQPGAVKGEGGFAKFSSVEQGVQALKNQIRLDSSRGYTLGGFINKYAPPTENNTSQYITQAVDFLKVPPTTPINQIPLDQLTKFMALKESSTKIS
jgi:hypothetical protein